MASTIQLKTGTGSAVPSSLTQGEVGINIDNGLIYYGSGSGNDVKQLENFTNITASGNISSSSDIIGVTGSFNKVAIDNTTVLQEGNDIIVVGDTGLNHGLSLGGTFMSYNSQNSSSFVGSGGASVIIDHNSGHITASGNISASGNIINTGNVTSDGSGSFSHVESSGNIFAGDAKLISFGGGARGTIAGSRIVIGGGFNGLSGQITITSGSTGTAVFDCGVRGGKIGLGDDSTSDSKVTVHGDLKTTSHITASGNISASGTIISSTLSGGATGNQSGSLVLSGSLTLRANAAEPAVSASTLFVKSLSTDDAPDKDLRFSNSGLTPAFAWVTLDNDGTDTSSEVLFGVGSTSVTSTAHNMKVVYDSSTNGVRIHSQIDGIYKVTGNYAFDASTADTTMDIKVNGSTVHTFVARVHGSVDPVERTHVYVGTVNSGSFVTATADGSSLRYEAGSVLMVERMS